MLAKFFFYFFLVKLIHPIYLSKIYLNYNSTPTAIDFSAHGQIIVYATVDLEVTIKRIQQTYSQYSYVNYTYPGILISGIKISKDLKTIAMISAANNSLQIYQYDTTSLYLNQSLVVVQPYIVQFSENSEYIFVGKNGAQIFIFKRNSVGNYVSYQNLTVTDLTNVIWTDSNNLYLVLAGDDMRVRFYKNINGQFTQFNQIIDNQQIKNIWVADDLHKVIISGYGATYRVYLCTDGVYSMLEEVTTTYANISSLKGNKNGSIIGYLDSSQTYIFYAKEQLNGSYTVFQAQDNSMTRKKIFFDESGSRILVQNSNRFILCFGCNFAHCISCINLRCQACEEGYIISSGLCQSESVQPIVSDTQPPPFIDNDNSNTSDNDNSNTSDNPIDSICSVQLTELGFCQKYCHQSCSSCQYSQPNKCKTCSPLFKKDQNGDCILQNQSIKTATIVNPFVSTIKHSKTKIVFLFLADIWLYQYHQPSYAGIMENFLQTVRIIESKRDEFIGMDRIPYVSVVQQLLKKYDLYANQKYLKIQRKDDSIAQNITNFVLEVIPLTLIMFLLVKILFRIFFNYQISSYLRPISFAGCIAVSIFEGNIEFFIFLGVRNLQYLFAENFSDKIHSVFVVFFLFNFVLYSFGSYFLLHYFYQKLFKYFLTNLFRINGASWLMLCLFCVRPFISGCIHSLFYHNHSLQLFLLGSLDLSVFLIVNCIEIKLGIYKSKLSFMCMSIYLLCGVPFNILMRLIVVYKDDSMLMQVFDSAIIIVLLSRGICVVLSALFEIVELYKCKQGQVTEQNQQKTKKDVNRQNQSMVSNDIIKQKPQKIQTKQTKQNIEYLESSQEIEKSKRKRNQFISSKYLKQIQRNPHYKNQKETKPNKTQMQNSNHKRNHNGSKPIKSQKYKHKRQI